LAQLPGVQEPGLRWQVALQQSEVALHGPPMGLQVGPPSWQALLTQVPAQF
jgi:hypothetical protein